MFLSVEENSQQYDSSFHRHLMAGERNEQKRNLGVSPALDHI